MPGEEHDNDTVLTADLVVPIASPIAQLAQVLGDGVQAVPGEELLEDPADYGNCGLVDRQRAQPLAVGGLRRVRVQPCVGQCVTVGRSSTEVAALDLSLGHHGGADPDPDPVRSPFDTPPRTDMIRSWASLSGSIGPPTSGTQSLNVIVTPGRSG